MFKNTFTLSTKKKYLFTAELYPLKKLIKATSLMPLVCYYMYIIKCFLSYFVILLILCQIKFKFKTIKNVTLAHKSKFY